MGSGSSTKAKPDRAAAVSEDALRIPAFNKLAGRRVVLASASPRRREILASVGFHPEVIPSTFKEDLPKTGFVGEAAYQYPAETATQKALEVYKRLVHDCPDDPPDLVIGADTVVIKGEEIMEKPLDALDNFRMLAELNDGECEVVTGVVVVHPTLQAPGYQAHTVSEKTVVRFAENRGTIIQAYVDSGEGLDRAGGFAIQGKASILVKSIDGDYNNVVGFPLFTFCSFLDDLIEDGELDFA
ncbi:Maf-like protein [Acaromyces ingoldii]|uniref:Maf-like protein n=1 Tax=Acaromyces ingoldii TaxID=215250 RepID=A0A316YLB9_9BASI|nr:Maf-like protein [Acaromyces ingoldii]PWN89856.1 Maf-like protein [Acaromyces ingoldii]